MYILVYLKCIYNIHGKIFEPKHISQTNIECHILVRIPLPRDCDDDDDDDGGGDDDDHHHHDNNDDNNAEQYKYTRKKKYRKSRRKRIRRP